MNLMPLDELVAFEEARRAGIGSTDAAAILGISPWSNPFDVWLSKTGQKEVKQPTLPMWLGLRLQSVVAELYEIKSAEAGQQVRVRADRRLHVHPQRRWQFTHLDYRIRGRPRYLIECKTSHTRDGWGEPGSANIPAHYWTQVQHEMAVVNGDVTDVAVLFGHRAFEIFTVLRDVDFIERMTDAEQEFHERYVLTGTPPPIDHTDAARRFLNRRYPKDDGIILPATPEQHELTDAYRAALDVQATADKNVDRLKNRLIEIIGPNAGLRGGDFEITYRQVKGGEPVVDYELVIDSLRHELQDRGLWYKPIEERYQTLLGLYVKPGRKAHRRFDFKDKKGDVQ